VKGNFRLKGIRSTNPVAVGDRVTFSSPSTGGGQEGVSSTGGGQEGVSYLIDTPGIKGFGTFDMEPEEITSYFKEIFRFSKDCRFSNCTHTHEPGCAVLKALGEHYIAESRYQSYLSMLDDKDEGKYRAPQ
jgi:ribosome biogenesis GTPase